MLYTIRMLLPNTPQARIARYVGLYIAIGIVGIVSTIFVYGAVSRTNNNHLIDRAETIAAGIDADSLAQIVEQPDLKDQAYTQKVLASAEYAALKTKLSDIRLVNSDARFVYILTVEPLDSKAVFIADSEPTDSEDYSPFGQVYDEASSIVFDVFNSAKVGFEGPLSDRWGTWITAYAPIVSSQGSIVGLVGIDVDARSHIANAIAFALIPMFVTLIIAFFIAIVLYQRQREAIYLEEKAQFLSIAAHEIRSPLTGIRWASETLLAPGTQLGAHERDMVSRMYTSCVNLVYRINNLLSVSALDTGNMKTLNLEPLLLRPFVQDIVQMLSLSAQEHKVDLIIDPSLVETIEVMCDRDKMRYIITNLCTNGIKYTKPHTSVRVGYRTKADGTTCTLTVSDEGNGIPVDERPHIFDGYRRLRDAVRSNQDGTGLGLYLAKKLIELHGGSISFETVVGKGTTFFVELPILPIESTDSTGNV